MQFPLVGSVAFICRSSPSRVLFFSHPIPFSYLRFLLSWPLVSLRPLRLSPGPSVGSRSGLPLVSLRSVSYPMHMLVIIIAVSIAHRTYPVTLRLHYCTTTYKNRILSPVVYRLVLSCCCCSLCPCPRIIAPPFTVGYLSAHSFTVHISLLAHSPISLSLISRPV
ncbi:hypothetical protein C8Q77DRAFT_447723 [Trametes polyzona]|nr:hypothetical protein C8Q77DRAFT_447723 [Trametes polyzona]